MTQLTWDDPGTRIYETGVDRGVLYVSGYDGVPWNGITSILEKPSGGTPEFIYIDGEKTVIAPSSEEFYATLNAFTYPDEFETCDGITEPLAGMLALYQPRTPFSLSYRTIVGNDLTENDFAYKIHLIYNAVASPSQKSYKSISNAVSPNDFAWDISAIPIAITGNKGTAHIIIDSRKVNQSALMSIEDILYGTATTAPRMPTYVDLYTAIAGFAPLVVLDNGDGTFTITGDASIVVMLDVNTYEISGNTVVAIDANTYSISSA